MNRSALPGVGRPLALADVEDLAGVGPGGHQRMQIQHLDVPVGALLGVTVDLVGQSRRIAAPDRPVRGPPVPTWVLKCHH
jgi:hypothetical protein